MWNGVTRPGTKDGLMACEDYEKQLIETLDGVSGMLLPMDMTLLLSNPSVKPMAQHRGIDPQPPSSSSKT